MQPNATRSKRILRPLHWALIVFVALVLSVVICVRLLPGPQTDIESLRKAGLPTSLEELDRWLPQVSASNNAALFILDAVDKRVAPSAALEQILPLLSPATELGEEKDDLETYIERNKEALDLIHRAALLPSARYPLNLSNSFGIQRLAEVKALANLLKAEAVYYIQKQNPDLALRSIQSSFGVARTLRHEPALISELVRIAMVAIALGSLESILEAKTFSSDQLAAISETLTLAEADAKAGAYRAFVSERAILLHYLNLPSGEFIKAFNPTGVANPVSERLKITAYQVLNIRGRDQRLFLEIMGKLTDAATNDYPEALRMAGEIERELDRRLATGFGRFAIISPMLHSMRKVMEKEAAILTRLRCARTALAVERYRYAHEGRLPSSLDDLVPVYLPEVPRDPAVGELLRFDETKNAYRVFSSAAAGRLKNARTATFRIPK